MSNYGRHGKTNAATYVAIVLALILIAGAVLGLGAHFGGWFDSSDDTEITETDSAEESSSSTSTSTSSEEASSSSSSDSSDSSGTEVLIVD